MKIALITIHRVTNYGAILQAFATKKILGLYGDVKIIDYNKEHLSQSTDLLRFKLSVHGIKMFLHDLLNFRNRYELLRKLKKFNRDYMNLSSEMDKNKLDLGSADNFDVYVCGSDQIWNPIVVSRDRKIDPIFFLSFVKNNAVKFSYASSIGHYEFNEIEKVEVKKLLQDFKMISVRESDGKKKIEDIIQNKEIHHVVDPTLLLPKNEWYRTFNVIEKVPKDKYILVYSVPRTDLIKKAIAFFASKLGFKVKAIDKMLFPITKIDEHIRNAGPKEFIQLYANASFVITDSFHGTCFAINFEKPFVCISANERANRQQNLLSILNISERIMFKESDFSNLNLNVDYTEVTPKLNKAREESLEYIEAAMAVKS
ncbi:Polysaccharide pyruvyl transferase [Maribacter orientalis]|uniref:Polysaccharide pyruvyl transferase n=1 Tax=Maribacter orientalis TaxID=228957 RepID=A0A1H7THY1_9FLAO|nr:polysaccharide pyruvyl transferase family protein [Maribacter orientalis]SEL84014.1 Polysaccharide pyruvyl transferase [Maribacter orientalis]